MQPDDISINTGKSNNSKKVTVIQGLWKIKATKQLHLPAHNDNSFGKELLEALHRTEEHTEIELILKWQRRKQNYRVNN